MLSQFAAPAQSELKLITTASAPSRLRKNRYAAEDTDSSQARRITLFINLSFPGKPRASCRISLKMAALPKKV